MVVSKLFTAHPESVGESYLQHLARAVTFASFMLWGGVACLVHAVLPFLCVKTASRIIADLNQQMVLHRTKTLRPVGTTREHLAL